MRIVSIVKAGKAKFDFVVAVQEGRGKTFLLTNFGVVSFAVGKGLLCGEGIYPQKV